MVRALPSGVGQFEAQVIDFNKTYKTIMANQAAMQKRQAKVAEDVDKSINLTLNDKRIVRPQEATGISELRRQLNKFYSDNSASVKTGSGSAYNTAKEMQGQITRLIDESAALRAEGNTMEAYVSKNTTSGNRMSNKAMDVWESYQQPLVNADGTINKNRMDATFENRVGVKTPLNALSILDMDAFKSFDFTSMDKALDTQVEYKPVNIPSIQKINGVDTNVDTKYTLPDPLSVTGVVSSFFSQYQDAAEKFTPEWNTIKSNPEKLKAIQENFQGFLDLYEKAGLPVRVIGDPRNLESKVAEDGTPGISNEFEYAVYKSIEKKLPMQLGRKYSYGYANLQLGYARLNEAKAYNRWKKNENVGLDTLIIQDIKQGKFKPEELQDILNRYLNIPNYSTGAPEAGRAQLVNGGKQINLEIIKPIFDINDEGDEVYVKDKDRAIKLAGSDASRVVQGRAGEWYAKQTYSYDIDKSNPSMSTNVEAALGVVYDGIENEGLKAQFSKMFKLPTKETEFGGRKFTRGK